MTDKQRWQQPVFLDPAQLQGGEPKVAEEEPPQRPREIPLNAVHSVAAAETQEAVAPVQRARLSAGRGSKWRKRFALSVGALLSLGVGVELYRLLRWGFDTHWSLGYGFAALLLVVFGSGALWLRHSLQGLRQLKQSADFRQEATTLLRERGHGQAAAYLARLTRHYQHTPVAGALKEAISEVDTAYNDGEIIQFVSGHAFKAQDEAAYRIVTRYSVESAVLVGVSPYATFDMLLVGWRNLRLLNEIAGLYGVVPGVSVQWHLLKQILHNMAFAGITEITFDAGESLLGGTLTSSVSARVGQGLGAGLITARIGLQAMQACRPMPFNKHQQPGLQAIQQRLLDELKRIGGRTA